MPTGRTMVDSTLAIVKQSIKEHLFGNRARIRELEHAFETTAADRDRIAAELKTYRHAFETTAADRDRWKNKFEGALAALANLLDSADSSKASDKAPSPLPAPRRAADALQSLAMLALSGEPDAERALAQFKPGLADLHVPNLYCVGVPKASTSYFYSILRQHPGIFLSDKDLGPLVQLAIATDRNGGGIIERSALSFDLMNRNSAAAYASEPVLGVFDVGFIRYPSGAQLIHKHLCPDARILIFLRDPMQRIVSEYVMHVRQFNPLLRRFAEPEDFHRALELEAERETEDWLLFRQYYSYSRTGQYYRGIKNYIELFGRENVKVIIGETDIRKNIAKTILDVFAFLGLDDRHAIEIACADHSRFAEISRKPEEISVTFVLASGERLTDAMAGDAVAVDHVAAIEIRSDVSAQLNLDLDRPSSDDIRAALSLRRRHATKLAPAEEKELYDRYYREDVGALEQLIGRDLSCWYARYEGV